MRYLGLYTFYIANLIGENINPGFVLGRLVCLRFDGGTADKYLKQHEQQYTEYLVTSSSLSWRSKRDEANKHCCDWQP